MPDTTLPPLSNVSAAYTDRRRHELQVDTLRLLAKAAVQLSTLASFDNLLFGDADELLTLTLRLKRRLGV